MRVGCRVVSFALKKGAVGQKENQGDVMRVSSIDPV